MNPRKLRHGYTTGACAAAAAKGAALMLLRQQRVDRVELTLPTGGIVPFILGGQRFDKAMASCFVIKDAGDDPDITNGAEIHASVFRSAEGAAGQVVIVGGTGVGRVTKPGLAVPPGEWAINPVPLQMITQAVWDASAVCSTDNSWLVEISIPDGAERALKTLNARLGIIGGLSILGTTGIVKPISVQAWTDTIDAAVSVAQASGSDSVIFCTGRTSELTAQQYFRDSGNMLPEESYVMMGDHVGYALKSAAGRGVARIVLACQFAKLLKIACGHEQTHVASSELDLADLAGWLAEDGRTARLQQLAAGANTARQVLTESGNDPGLIELVTGRAKMCARQWAPAVAIKVLLAGYTGEVVYFG